MRACPRREALRLAVGEEKGWPPGPLLPPAAAAAAPRVRTLASYFLRMDEFQWFLMALSVRPCSSVAISAQRCPTSRHAVTMTRSSSSVHGSLLMSGERWLCHLGGAGREGGGGSGGGVGEQEGSGRQSEAPAPASPLATLLADAPR